MGAAAISVGQSNLQKWLLRVAEKRVARGQLFPTVKCRLYGVSFYRQGLRCRGGICQGRPLNPHTLPSTGSVNKMHAPPFRLWQCLLECRGILSCFQKTFHVGLMGAFAWLQAVGTVDVHERAIPVGQMPCSRSDTAGCLEPTSGGSGLSMLPKSCSFPVLNILKIRGSVFCRRAFAFPIFP